MTNAVSSALSVGCGRLQSINLSGCVKVTDAGVVALGAGCGRLQSIDLSGCDDVIRLQMQVYQLWVQDAVSCRASIFLIVTR